MTALRLAADPRRLGVIVIGEWRAMSRPLRAWLLGLSAVLALAGFAALLAVPPGWEVLGTTPTVEWGFLIIGYVAFAITTSGLCLASSLGTVFGVERFRPLEKRHAVLAVLCLCAAFGIIALDLHWPVRMVLGAVLNPSPTSPMWWMGAVYGVYLVVLLVELWSMFTHRARIHQWACTLAAGIAIVAPTTLGAVFGVLVSRPFWHGPFTPLLMLASAILAGTALLALVFGLVGALGLRDHERARVLAVPGLRWILTGALIIVGLLVTRQVAAGLLGSGDILVRATEALVAGPLALPFWGGRVVAGLVLPLLLLWLPRTRSSAGMAAAGGLALAGVLVDRTLFVLAGQIVPTSSATAGVVSPTYAPYTPSPVEIGIIAGGVAFVALAYTLVERFVDLTPDDEHIALSLEPLRRLVRRTRQRRIVEDGA